MKNMKCIATLLALLATHESSALLVALQGRSFFSTRSQSVDAARELVGWHKFINRTDTDGWYTAFSITPEYSRAYRLQRLAEYFFGDHRIAIGGSQVSNRPEIAFLADYFGLSQTFLSSVLVEPDLQNVITDFDWYAGYGPWFFRIHAPAVWTKSMVKLYENIENRGIDTPYPAGYMDFQALQAPFCSFCRAIQGEVSYGQIQALKEGKMNVPRIATGLAEIQMALGYNIVRHELGHFGVMLRASAPTGTRPTSEFLFEPIVGNASHDEHGDDHPHPLKRIGYLIPLAIQQNWA